MARLSVTKQNFLVKADNYRDYLSSIFEAEKRSGRSTSLNAFGKKIGLSESNLRMVLAGKRRLTISNIHRIAEGLRLSHSQTLVFEASVLKEQAQTKSEKQFYTRKFKTESSKRALKDVQVSGTGILNEWFGPALLVYLREEGLTEVSDELLADLGKKLKVAESDLRSFIETVKKRGYLTDKTSTKEYLRFDVLTSSQAQITYIKSCMAQSLKRLESDYVNKRSRYSVKSFSIKEEDIDSFVNDYNSLLEKYMSREAKEPTGEVTLQVTMSAIRIL